MATEMSLTTFVRNRQTIYPSFSCQSVHYHCLELVRGLALLASSIVATVAGISASAKESKLLRLTGGSELLGSQLTPKPAERLNEPAHLKDFRSLSLLVH